MRGGGSLHREKAVARSSTIANHTANCVRYSPADYAASARRRLAATAVRPAKPVNIIPQVDSSGTIVKVRTPPDEVGGSGSNRPVNEPAENTGADSGPV
jgi:hypothetical protein